MTISDDEKNAYFSMLEKRLKNSKTGLYILNKAVENGCAFDFDKNIHGDAVFNSEAKIITLNPVFSKEQMMLAFIREIRRAEQNEAVLDDDEVKGLPMNHEKDSPKSYLMKKILLEGDRRTIQCLVVWELAGKGDDSLWISMNLEIKLGFTNHIKFGNPDNPFPKILASELPKILNETLKAYIHSYEKGLSDVQYLDMLENTFVNEKVRKESEEILSKIKDCEPPFKEGSEKYNKHQAWLEELKIKSIPYYSQETSVKDAIAKICRISGSKDSYWNEEPENFAKEVFLSVSRKTKKHIKAHFKRIKKVHKIPIPDLKGFSTYFFRRIKKKPEFLITKPEIITAPKPDVVIVEAKKKEKKDVEDSGVITDVSDENMKKAIKTFNNDK